MVARRSAAVWWWPALVATTAGLVAGAGCGDRPTARPTRGTCDDGDAVACVTAARAHLDGTARPARLHEALGLLARGCQLGHAGACMGEARLAFGRAAAVPDDRARYGAPEAAAAALTRACTLGHQVACAIASSGGPPPPEPAPEVCALGALDACCDDGEAQACLALGERRRGAERVRLLERAAMLFEAQCDVGQAQRCVSALGAYRTIEHERELHPVRERLAARALSRARARCDDGDWSYCLWIDRERITFAPFLAPHDTQPLVERYCARADAAAWAQHDVCGDTTGALGDSSAPVKTDP